MRERDESKGTALRIMDQYNSRDGMTYDLKCEGVKLTLTMTKSSRADDPAAWRIEASGASTAEHRASVTAWGESRALALDAIAAAWGASRDTEELRVFDWDAVAKALRTVRAI